MAEIAIALGGDPAIPPPMAFALWALEISDDPVLYDPSNGTVSRGDILRTGKGIFEPSLVGL